jgi:hypothetical protein
VAVESLERIEGPDPPQRSRKPIWNRRRVTLWMVSAWREGRRPSFQGALSTVRSALDWASLYFPLVSKEDIEARDLLILYLWSQAEGESFRDVCRRRRKSRSTAMRRVNWALDQIVEGLNRDAEKASP